MNGSGLDSNLRSFFRLAGWLGAAVLVAVSAFGFWHSGILHEAVWTPAGLDRLLAFAAAYWVLCLIVTLLRRSAWIPLVGAVVLLYSVTVAGPAILLLLFSAFVAGRILLGDSAEDGTLALLTGLAIFQFLVNGAAHFRVNYPAVYVVALCIPVVLRRHTARQCWREARSLLRPRMLPMREHLALAVTIFAVAAQWLVALKPEVSADGLAMHLVVPAHVAFHHLWKFDVTRFSWAVMPMAGDWCYTAAYLAGGEFTARLLNLSLLLATAALVYRVTRRWIPQAAALLLVAAFLASPVAQLETGSLFVDNFLAAMLVGGIVAAARLREEGGTRFACACGILLGTAVAAKLGGMTFVATLAPFCVWVMRRTRRRLALAGLLLVCFALPPYLEACLRTGNPVFPFANDIFRSPLFPTGAALGEPRFHAPPGWSTLYDITFHTSRYLESQDGGFNFQYLILLPMSVLLLRRRWPWLGGVCLAAALAACCAILHTRANMRYLYPALPLFTVAIGASWSIARSENRKLYGALLGACAILIVPDIYFLAASGWYHKDFFLPPFDQAARESYILEHAPGRKLVEYMNRQHPDAPLLFLVNGQSAGLHGRAYLNSWHNETFYCRLSAAPTPEAARRLLVETHLKYLVAPSPEHAAELPQPPLRALVEKYTEPEYTAGGYFVARLR